MRWVFFSVLLRRELKKHSKQALFSTQAAKNIPNTEYPTFCWRKASNTADKFTKSKDDQWNSDGFPHPHAQVLGKSPWNFCGL